MNGNLVRLQVEMEGSNGRVQGQEKGPLDATAIVHATASVARMHCFVMIVEVDQATLVLRLLRLCSSASARSPTDAPSEGGSQSPFDPAPIRIRLVFAFSAESRSLTLHWLAPFSASPHAGIPSTGISACLTWSWTGDSCRAAVCASIERHSGR